MLDDRLARPAAVTYSRSRCLSALRLIENDMESALQDARR